MKARLFAGPIAVLCALSFGLMGTASAAEVVEDSPTVAECDDLTIVTPSYYAAHAAEPYENFETNNGSATFAPDGLQIEATNGTVAGVLATETRTSLSAAGDPTLFSAAGDPDLSTDFSGAVPGYILQIDSDAFDQIDGPVTLVQEGPDWWSDYDLENGGAYAAGSRAFQGSLDEALGLVPDAWVTGFGFSFGPGATGEGLLGGLTFGCASYLFSSVDAFVSDADCGDQGPYADIVLVNEDTTPMSFEIDLSSSDEPLVEDVEAGATRTVTVDLPEGEDVDLVVTAADIELFGASWAGEDTDCSEPSPSPSPTHDNSTPTPATSAPAPTTSAPVPTPTTAASANTGAAVLGNTDELAQTGGNVGPLALAGVLLLGLGTAALAVTRRRHTDKNI